MHKPEFVQENVTNKILWDFQIQADHSISDRKPDQVLTNKKNLIDFTAPANYGVKI